MSLPNRRHSLTDKNAIDDIEELRCYVGVETDKDVIEYRGYEDHKFKGVFIGLVFYDYGGGNICIKETTDYKNADGFLYADKATILKEYGGKILTKDKKEKALQILRGELDTFNQYLEGDVFGYAIYRTAKQDFPKFAEYTPQEQEEIMQYSVCVDSCWGFYYDSEDYLFKDEEKNFTTTIQYDHNQNEQKEMDRVIELKEKEDIEKLQLCLPLSDKEKSFNIKVVKHLYPCILD